MAGTGTTNLSGTVTLDGFEKYLAGNRQVVSNGATTLSEANLNIYAPGDESPAPTWTNNGTFHVTDDADILLQDFGGSRPRFDNVGTFTKSGAATETIISTEFNNSGNVNLNSGYLSLYDGTDSGSYTLSPLTELSFYGGVRTLAATSSISGPGKVGVYGGNVTVDGVLNLSGAGQLVVQGGTLDVNGAFAAPSAITISGGYANFNTPPITMSGPVTLSAGGWGGSANLTANDTFHWSGGDMAGTGTTTLAGTTTLDGLDKYLAGNRQVVSNGATTLSEANLNIYAPGDESPAPTWTNNGTFHVTDDADILLQDFGGSRPRFDNVGTFTKSGAATETIISTEFNNSGNVNLNSGYLSLYDGTDSGSYTLSPLTELSFYGGVRTLSATSSISGPGKVGVYGGNVTVDGTLNLSGAGQLVVQGGTLDVNGAIQSLAVPVSLGSGSLGGSADLAISGVFHWSGGDMVGTGTTTLAGTTTLDGLDKYLAGNRQVVSNGATTLSEANLNIYAPGDESPAPTWTNNGTFHVTDDADILLQDFGGSRPKFNNVGTFTKSGAATETIISTEFNNSGNVNLNSGYLSLYDGADSGSYTLSPLTELSFYGGVRTLAATSSISGPGKLGVYGGNVTVDGTLNLSGAGQLVVQGGSLDVNGAIQSLAVPVSLGSGSLGGSADLAISGVFHWSGGDMVGTGTTTLAGTTTLDGLDKYLAGNRQMVSGGATTLSEANLNIYAPGDESPAPTWTNNGTFHVTDDADILLQDFGGSRPKFNNVGTFTKSDAATETIISTEFHNSGTVNLNSGHLKFAGQFTQTAGNLRLTGGTLSADAPLEIQGGRLSGTGTISGDVANNGIIAPGLSAGSLTIAGDLTLGPNSKFEFEIGGPTAGTQYDFVAEAGVAQLQLDGLLSLTLINGFVPSPGQTFAVLRSRSPPNQFFRQCGQRQPPVHHRRHRVVPGPLRGGSSQRSTGHTLQLLIFRRF